MGRAHDRPSLRPFARPPGGVLLAWLVLGSPFGARAVPLLDAPVLIPTGDPWAVCTADLDGDGVREVVIGTTSGVDVFGGDAAGGFTLRASIDLGIPAVEVRMAHMNADTLADIVALHRPGNRVSVCLGGAGLSFPSTATFGTGPSPSALAIGDLDGDGDLDVVTADQNGGSCSVLRGDGAGGLVFAGTIGPFQLPWGLALADFDGDGALDAAVSDYAANELVLVEGRGDATFGSMHRTAVPQGPVEIVARRATASEPPDVAVASRLAGVVTLLRGDGAFGWRSQVGYTTGSDPVDLDLDDLDGDGLEDLLVTDAQTPSITPLLGEVGGTFVAHAPLAAQRALRASAIAGDALTRLVVGALPPIGAGETTGWLWVSRLQPDDSGVAPVSSEVTALVPAHGDAGDCDGDGNLDLVVGASQGSRLVWLAGTGTGRVRSGVESTTPSGQIGVRLGYLDADPHLDAVVLRQSPDALTMARGLGTGAFAPVAEVRPPGRVVGVAIGPLDPDPFGDVLVTCSRTDSVAVWRGSAGGGFALVQAWKEGRILGAPSLRDLDGDGVLDAAYVGLRATGADGDLFVHHGRGDGTFDPPVKSDAGQVPSSVLFADLDGDRIDDALVASLSRRAIRALMGRGDGTFQPGPTDTLLYPTPDMAVVDLDADGAPELVLVDDATNRLLVAPGAGGGAFGTAVQFDVGADPRKVLVGDANGDGRSDLIVLRGSTIGAVATVLRGGPFPNVSVRSFGARAVDAGVELVWTAEVATAGLAFRGQRRGAGPEGGWVDVAELVPAGAVGPVSLSVVDTSVPAAGTYWYRLAAVAGEVEATVAAPLAVRVVAHASSVTAAPTPFRDTAEITFTLPGVGAEVSIDVFDVTGRRVRKLAAGPRSAGPQSVTWDGRGDAGQPSPSGVYLVVVRGTGFSRSARVLLVR